jgi:hypothetical protein
MNTLRELISTLDSISLSVFWGGLFVAIVSVGTVVLLVDAWVPRIFRHLAERSDARRKYLLELRKLEVRMIESPLPGDRL